MAEAWWRAVKSIGRRLWLERVAWARGGADRDVGKGAKGVRVV